MRVDVSPLGPASCSLPPLCCSGRRTRQLDTRCLRGTADNPRSYEDLRGFIEAHPLTDGDEWLKQLLTINEMLGSECPVGWTGGKRCHIAPFMFSQHALSGPNIIK